MDKAPWKVMVFVTILVAIIGCVATIAAALIGILPEVIRSTPTTGTQISALTVTTRPTPTTPLPTPEPPTATLQPPPAPQPTAVPALGIGSTQVSDIDGMTLLYVPAGEFTMGSNDGDANEKPPHTVYLDAFWIDQTEVTNALYAKCVKAGGCQAPSSTTSYTRASYSYYGNAEFDNYPVMYVSWDDAKKYCTWAGGDLPTEAQWEKAARGNDQRTYPWGNQAPDKTRLNYNSALNFDQDVSDTTEVGKYPTGASFYGALDMAGNVFEWVADWYDEKDYSSALTRNPSGPSSGTYRVLRGGSWVDVATNVRASYRVSDNPDARNVVLGFRCAR
jgi:eukaryotic-like serine/threonine-protein kinase